MSPKEPDREERRKEVPMATGISGSIEGRLNGHTVSGAEYDPERVEKILSKIPDEEGDYLRALIETDPLTKAYNKRVLEHDIKVLIEESKTTGIPLSLLIIDIDFFKRMNDNYGHSAGDLVLRALVRNLRAQDSIVYRYGGEEFAVVLRGANLDDAVKVGERLNQSINERLKFYCDDDRRLYEVRDFKFEDTDGRKRRVDDKGKVVGVTVSIGVAQYDKECRDGGALISRADQALYKAKESGRNRVEAYRE